MRPDQLERRLRERLDALGPAPRADLLHVLMLPDFEQADGISRSEVSRICKVLDEEVRTFLGRSIEQPCPYLWLDATFHKVREARRAVFSPLRPRRSRLR